MSGVAIADLEQQPIAARRPHLDPNRVSLYDRSGKESVVQLGGWNWINFVFHTGDYEHLEETTRVTVYHIDGQLRRTSTAE